MSTTRVSCVPRPVCVRSDEDLRHRGYQPILAEKLSVIGSGSPARVDSGTRADWPRDGGELRQVLF